MSAAVTTGLKVIDHWIGGEAVGNSAAGSAGSDNHVVVGRGGHWCGCPLQSVMLTAVR